MTIARGAAALALALVIVLAVAWLLLRGAGGHEYTLMFENAGQLVTDNDVQVGGRRVGSVKSIELTEDNQAAVRSRCRSPTRRCARARDATIRAHVAVGHRQPLHRADARRPATPRQLDDGAHARHRVDHAGRRPRPDLQHARRAHARRPARPGHQGLRDAVQRQGRRGRARRSSTSTRCCRRRAGSSASSTEDEDGADALPRRLLAPGHGAGRAARRPLRRSSATRTRRRGRSARRTSRWRARSGCCRRRCGAPTRRS